MRPLYAFATSAKRHALFNLDEAGRPVLRKATQHGLGHLQGPYVDADAPENIPVSPVLRKLGVSRWQHDLWFKIVEAALADRRDRVVLDYHPSFDLPALSRYGATSPRLLDWFKAWNDGKPYRDQVKPFNFLTALIGRSLLVPIPEHEAEQPRERGRPKKRKVAPIAPFEREPEKAAARAFDRNTGRPVRIDLLKTYREALCQYHLACEHKFRNGQHRNSGVTERRSVMAIEVRLIGKESNKLENETIGIDIASYGSIDAAASSSKKAEG